MASTSDIRNGLCLDFNNGIWTIIDFQHVKPGKGAAFVRTKLKNVETGKVIDNTFPAGHKINEVRIERRKFQFLYKDDQGYHFMNNETFEQVMLEEGFISSPQFMLDGMEIEMLYHAEKNIPLTCEMPQNVVLTVTYTEPGVKGDTATNTLKPATVQTGAQVNVPLFINEGDTIKVDTATGSYMERVRN